jgi:hypothetical protein
MVTGTSASGCRAGPLSTAPVSTLNFDPWHGQAPLAGTVHPMCVQIAVWQTTVPFDAARITGPDGASTLIAPAAVTSATDPMTVPLGAAADGAAAEAAGAAELVAGAAADVAAFDEAAADVAAAELVADVVVVVVLGELQAAAASTAVPEAARTVRRGRLRGAGVTAGVLQVGSAGAAARPLLITLT